MGRVGSVLLLALIMALAAVPGGMADNIAGGDEVVVAVLDTGVRASHETFDYEASGGTGDGPAGQLVAWWDFTDERGSVETPAPGETWDDRWGPYDNHGHGTQTASIAAGEGFGITDRIDLAVGKVATANGSIQNLERAYNWAVNTVGADVVSISIGTPFPSIGLFEFLDEQIHWAREQGVLTVVAGNGLGNACGPQFSWSSASGYTSDALSVGSLFENGGTHLVVTCSSLDPDVASHGYQVPAASHESDTGSEDVSGTSFAAPNVAGAAAHLMETALAAGQDADPAEIEELILSCADPVWPYHVSGAGFFYTAQYDEAVPRASDDTLCPEPDSPIQQAFGTHGDVWRTAVAEPMKVAFSEGADSEDTWMLAPTGQSTDNGPGVIGPSVPAGATELEVYEVSLSAGDRVTVTAEYEQPPTTVSDVDVGLFVPGALDDGVLEKRERVDWSAHFPGEDERFSRVAPLSGTYTVALWGWMTVADQPIDLTLESDGSLTFVTEKVAVATVVG